jgi:hypothetical protein
LLPRRHRCPFDRLRRGPFGFHPGRPAEVGQGGRCGRFVPNDPRLVREGAFMDQQRTLRRRRSDARRLQCSGEHGPSVGPDADPARAVQGLEDAAADLDGVAVRTGHFGERLLRKLDEPLRRRAGFRQDVEKLGVGRAAERAAPHPRFRRTSGLPEDLAPARVCSDPEGRLDAGRDRRAPGMDRFSDASGNHSRQSRTSRVC